MEAKLILIDIRHNPEPPILPMIKVLRKITWKSNWWRRNTCLVQALGIVLSDLLDKQSHDGQETEEGKSKLQQQFSLRKLLPFSHLWLVANSSHTAVIYEGENAFGVVSGDELCRLTNIVHVCAVGWASDLQGKTGTAVSNLARAASSWPASPAAGLGAIREHLQTEEFNSAGF